MISADYLFLMTDVDGLYSANPKKDPNARLVKFVDDVKDIESMLNSLELAAGSSWGTGGMAVKINAANLASSLGIQTTIMSAKKIDSVLDIVGAGSNRDLIETGTTFFPVREQPSKRKRWIRGLRCSGTILVDSGAAKAVLERHDIYAVGVKEVKGTFPYMAAVKILDLNGVELGVGLSNYSSIDLVKVCGKQTQEIASLEVSSKGPVIYRKNLAVDFSKDSLQNLKRYEKVSNSKVMFASFEDDDHE